MPVPILPVPFSRNESVFGDVQSSNVEGLKAEPATSQPSSNTTTSNNLGASSAVPLRLILPGFYYHSSRHMKKVDINDGASFHEYLRQELDVSRLLQIFQHLWLAGQPHAARPLHYQIMIGRAIVLTEKADRHLTWNGHQIFLKPLPDFLLDYSIWERRIATDQLLYESAVGFLLSYMWLISSKSDLKIAHDNGLLSLDIDWDIWVALNITVLSHIDHKGLAGVNPRYLYGELRISRLNAIWRILHRPWVFADLARGYTIVNREYSRFASKSFAWLLGSFLYITVVLTAMQVGLGANELDTNRKFQNACFGFTVFSIITPLFGAAIIVMVLLCAVVFNLNYTQRINDQRKDTYDRLWHNPALVRCRQAAASNSASIAGNPSTAENQKPASDICLAV